MYLNNEVKELLEKLKSPNLYPKDFSIEEIAEDVMNISESVDRPILDVLKIVLDGLT